MSKALSVFEKYLGKADHFSIPTLTPANITDINQIIGALQTIDKHLKKILAQPSLKDIDQDLISCCFFMGENLFDKEIFITAIQKNFHIHNIATILAKYTPTKAFDFLQEKRKEIASLLESIFAFLDSDQDDCTSSTQTQCFSPLREFY